MKMSTTFPSSVIPLYLYDLTSVSDMFISQNPTAKKPVHPPPPPPPCKCLCIWQLDTPPTHPPTYFGLATLQICIGHCNLFQCYLYQRQFKAVLKSQTVIQGCCCGRFVFCKRISKWNFYILGFASALGRNSALGKCEQGRNSWRGGVIHPQS